MVVYVTHTCKNKACRRAFMDTDRFNAQDTPPTWRYCPDYQAQGFNASPHKNRVEIRECIRKRRERS